VESGRSQSRRSYPGAKQTKTRQNKPKQAIFRVQASEGVRKDLGPGCWRVGRPSGGFPPLSHRFPPLIGGFPPIFFPSGPRPDWPMPTSPPVGSAMTINMTTAQQSFRRERRREERFQAHVSADQTLTKDRRPEREGSPTSGASFVRSGIAPAGGGSPTSQRGKGRRAGSEAGLANASSHYRIRLRPEATAGQGATCLPSLSDDRAAAREMRCGFSLTPRWIFKCRWEGWGWLAKLCEGYTRTGRRAISMDETLAARANFFYEARSSSKAEARPSVRGLRRQGMGVPLPNGGRAGALGPRPDWPTPVPIIAAHLPYLGRRCRFTMRSHFDK
jgi:hypothetical protein